LVCEDGNSSHCFAPIRNLNTCSRQTDTSHLLCSWNCLEQGCDCEVAPRAFQQGGQEARIGLLSINIIDDQYYFVFCFESVFRDSGFAVPKALLCGFVGEVGSNGGGGGSRFGGELYSMCGTTPRKTERGGANRVSFPSPSKTNISHHKSPDSSSKPEGMRMVKGWEVLFEGPRGCLIIPYLLRRMKRSLRLMSRHDPDLTESRTRGAIGPLYRWFRPPPGARWTEPAPG
jgi:hypothetical protein